MDNEQNESLNHTAIAREKMIERASEWYKTYDYSPEYPFFIIMADFALHILDKIKDEKNKEIRRIADQTPGLYVRDFGG